MVGSDGDHVLGKIFRGTMDETDVMASITGIIYLNATKILFFMSSL
jgi:hypothetical protein